MAISLGGMAAPVRLGTGDVRRIADGIRQTDATRRSSQTAPYAELSKKVTSQLGQAGLGRTTPPSYGLVPGVRFQPPPGTIQGAKGAAGSALAGKTRQWSEKLAAGKDALAATGAKYTGSEVGKKAGKEAEAVDFAKYTGAEVGKKDAQAGIIDVPTSKIAEAGIIDIPSSKIAQAGIIDVPSSKIAQAGIIDVPSSKIADTLAKPVPALDGKGNDVSPALGQLGSQIRAVGAMFGRIGEISGAIRDEMLQGLKNLRV